MYFENLNVDHILQVSASDRDLGINREIVYSLESGHNNDFKINKDTGSISVARSLDYGKKSLYRFRVKATDKGTPSLSGFALVTLTIKGILLLYPTIQYIIFYLINRFSQSKEAQRNLSKADNHRCKDLKDPPVLKYSGISLKRTTIDARIYVHHTELSAF